MKTINFDRFVVLEDFHYLPSETQQDFAIALKTFHELSDITFIVVGVWLEENRLTSFNGDLLGRVIPINVDKWTDSDLRSVIKHGEQKLNISFSEDFRKIVIEKSFGSVYMVQETCNLFCKKMNIFETKENLTQIESHIRVEDIIKELIDQQNGGYQKFITHFSKGLQKDTKFKLYQWILYAVLTADIGSLEQGLSLVALRKIIQAKHPNAKKLHLNAYTQALESISSLQNKIQIKPFIFDYDQSKEVLHVVDRLFMVWLANKDRETLVRDYIEVHQ